MADPFDLTGKVIIVTGGSRGLGREMCLAFAERGAKVVVASRKLENCEELAEEIRGKGGTAMPYGLHVGQWDALEPFVDAVEAELGPVDVLVNNAGLSPLYPTLMDVTEGLFDKVIEINLKGPYRLSAICGTRMAEREGGSIINVSSRAAVTPSPNAEPYGAAKAGLNSLTESMAVAFGPRVRVNCIQAGPFLTDISKAWDMEAFAERAAVNIPLGRGGNPDEIVGAALYFASDASSYTTGAILPVDGGPH